MHRTHLEDSVRDARQTPIATATTATTDTQFANFISFTQLRTAFQFHDDHHTSRQDLATVL